jgi:hypothetical protein
MGLPGTLPGRGERRSFAPNPDAWRRLHARRKRAAGYGLVLASIWDDVSFRLDNLCALWSKVLPEEEPVS